MNLKKIITKKWFKVLTNRYIIILLIFCVWMLIFDTNSWFTHRKLNSEISEIENNIEYYNKEIEKDKKTIKTLNDSLEIEKYARETYFMKRENEDVFIIKQDTTSKE